MKMHLKPGDVIVTFSLLFYGLVILVSNTDGRLCGQNEGVASCVREWTVAVGSVLGAFSVLLVSLIALRLEQGRDERDEKQKGRDYALAAIDVVRQADAITFRIKLAEYPGQSNYIEASFLDSTCDSLTSLVDRLVLVEKYNTFTSSSDIQTNMIARANSLNSITRICRLLYAQSVPDARVDRSLILKEIEGVFAQYTISVEKYAHQVESIAKKYGAVYLLSRAPANIETPSSAPIPPRPQTSPQ